MSTAYMMTVTVKDNDTLFYCFKNGSEIAIYVPNRKINSKTKESSYQYRKLFQ